MIRTWKALAAALLLASCSGGSGGGGESGADVNGQWFGAWELDDGHRGTASFGVTQTGRAVRGEAFLPGSGCFYHCAVQGEVFGDQFWGTLRDGTDVEISFVLTVTGPTDDALAGTIQVNLGGVCAGATGTIALAR